MARAPLAWPEYLCTVLLPCRVEPACLEPAWGCPVQHMYSMVIQGPYGLSCSHGNRCQKHSGFLFEKNQVFRGYHRGYPSGDLAATWLAISSWMVIPWKMVLFLLHCRLLLHVHHPQMQSIRRSFRRNLSSARMTLTAPGVLVQYVSQWSEWPRSGHTWCWNVVHVLGEWWWEVP